MQSWPADTIVDRNCNDVRRLINRLLDSREINGRDFCVKLGLNEKSFYAFMTQNGPWDGKRSNTFPFALHYFQEREREGVKMPRKVRPRPKISAFKSKSKSAAVLALLDGQQEDKVAVYDSCDEVRRKVKVHMRQRGTTQNLFLQDLSAQYNITPTTVKPSDMEKFRGARGPNAENANPVFYAAYVFFERARIRAGKEKSKLREEMEKIYRASGGVNVTVPSGKHGLWLDSIPRPGRVSFDKYGIGTLDCYNPGRTIIQYGPRGRPVAAPSEYRYYDLAFYVYE